MLRQRQYSLRQLLLLVTWVALAAVLIHYLLVTRGRLLEWIGDAIAFFVLFMLAAVGVCSLFHALRQIWYWPKTTAHVVRYCIKRDKGPENKGPENKGPENAQPFYHPVLRFETIDGQPVTTISSCGWWRRPWPSGDIVRVRYNPHNPKWAEIDCFTNIWGMPVTFLGLSAVIGVVMFWFG